MKISRKWLAGLFAGAACTLLVYGCTSPKGNSDDGKRWYTMHNCSACHGKNGNDGRAKAIAGIDMGFSRFSRYIRNPSSPSMPKFSENKLPEQDAADIYAWLKSLPE